MCFISNTSSNKDQQLGYQFQGLRMRVKFKDNPSNCKVIEKLIGLVESHRCCKIHGIRWLTERNAKLYLVCRGKKISPSRFTSHNGL